MSRTSLMIVAGLLFACGNAVAEDANSDWVNLFDGKDMNGWKASENKDSWKVVDGSLVCHGPRSHLFYVGDDKPFQNFEFECEVMTTPGSNAGIYIHTKYQEEGWPKAGHEVQVNITHSDPKKTGSLYGIVNVGAEDLEGLVKDNEWYKTSVRVEGKHITVKINDKTMVDYTEPADQKPFSAEFDRTLGKGTFALQAHDPDSKVMFRNLRVRRLP
ncbi:MAG: DUF1080 domain-containing protein [Planctomycetaceae bacterium]